MRRRVDVQPNDVGRFALEVWIIRNHVAVEPLRLQSVLSGQVDVATELHRRSPAEVVIRILAVRDPDLRGQASAKEQPVPIGREVWCEFGVGSVDVWPKVLGWSPRIVESVPLRNPDIIVSKPSRTVQGGNVEAKSIVRDCRMKVVDAGIHNWPEPDRVGPV